jgi:Ras family.
MTNLRIISENDGKSLASEFSVTYFETSAKNEIGVNEAFGFMANKI